MSGKTVRLKYHEKWGWWLSWGNETFYAEDRTMRTWDTSRAALDWLKANHPELRVVQTDEIQQLDMDQDGGPNMQLELF